MKIKDLITVCELLEENLTEFDELQADDGKWLDVHEALFEMSEALRKLQWIPCSERLPEVCDVYLVSGKMKYSHDKEWDYFVDVATNYGTYIDNYWDTSVDWDEGQEIHIIAWMPRPKPYRGDGEI